MRFNLMLTLGVTVFGEQMRNAMIEADQTVRGTETPRGIEQMEPVLV